MISLRAKRVLIYTKYDNEDRGESKKMVFLHDQKKNPEIIISW